MTKAIRVILLYVALPFLIIGIIIGAIVMVNSKIEAQYTVTELCKDSDCKEYETKINSSLIAKEEIESECNDFKSIKDKKIDELAKERNQFKSMLEEAYPSEMICYSDKNQVVDIKYEVEAEKQEEPEIIDYNKYSDIGYDIQNECAMCNYPEDNGKFRLICNNKDGWDWEPTNGKEAEYCIRCIRDSECRGAKVVSTVKVQVPKSVKLNLKKGEGVTFQINQSLPFQEKVKITNELKQYDCYFNKPESKIGSITTTPIQWTFKVTNSS